MIQLTSPLSLNSLRSLNSLSHYTLVARIDTKKVHCGQDEWTCCFKCVALIWSHVKVVCRVLEYLTNNRDVFNVICLIYASPWPADFLAIISICVLDLNH